MIASENTVNKVRTYQYQRNYLFEVMLPKVGSINPEQVESLIQDVTYSDYEMDEGEVVRFGPLQQNYAGFFAIKGFELTFRETEDHIVWKYLSEWRDRIYANGYFGNKGGANGYANPVTIHYLSNKSTITKSIKLVNSFPKRLESGQLSWGQSKILTYQIPFSCDGLEVQVNGAPARTLMPGQSSDGSKNPTGKGSFDVLKTIQTVLGNAGSFPSLPSKLPGQDVLSQRARQLMDIYNKAKVLQNSGKTISSGSKQIGKNVLKQVAAKYGVPTNF